MKTPLTFKTPGLVSTLILCLAMLSSCKKENLSVPQPAPGPAPVETAIASFEYSIEGTRAPVMVNFINTSANALSVTWDFGSGFTSGNAVVRKEFDRGGVYDVKLTAYGTGNSSTEIKHINIPDAAKQLNILSVTVTSINNTTDNEPAEDGGPDVYFKVLDNNLSSLYISTVVHNVSVFPLIWSQPITIDFGDDPDRKYTLQLWDNDVANPDDLIQSFDIVPADYMTLKNFYPGVINLSKGNTQVKLLAEWK